MIDFTNCPVNKFKGYGGANGNKINIEYENRSYMLKFPSVPTKNNVMSYTNSCISEYIACHICTLLGFTVQETMLGTYIDKKETEKIVVACADFTADGKKLMEFAHLKNTCIDSEQNGYGTELNTILKTIEEQTLLDSITVKEFFWDMFIVDALLGNFDRHNGNWGLLIDEKRRRAEIAPVYDCGSCLYPQLDIKQMEIVLKNEDEMNKRIYKFPTSAIMENGSKISYFDYISSLKNQDCNEALRRIHNKLNMKSIDELIENTETLSELQKDFYKIIIEERKTKILDYSYDLLMP